MGRRLPPGIAYQFTGLLGTDCYYAQADGVSASGVPCPQILPFMMSPHPGSRLTSTSPTFSWSSGLGVTFYELCLGSKAGKCHLYRHMSATALSMPPANLPEDGSTIHARLYAKINGTWYYRSYVYIAGDQR